MVPYSLTVQRSKFNVQGLMAKAVSETQNFASVQYYMHIVHSLFKVTKGILMFFVCALGRNLRLQMKNICSGAMHYAATYILQIPFESVLLVLYVETQSDEFVANLVAGCPVLVLLGFKADVQEEVNGFLV